MNEPVWPEHNWQQAVEAAAAEGDERPTWAYDWPAGKRLAGELTELATLDGQRVCDLGCGRGRLGLIAAMAGAQVTWADGSPHPLAFVAATAACNGLAGQHVLHQWGEPVPHGPYDLIVGGDILYRPECFTALLRSIADSLAPHGQALLSDPRSRLESELPEIAATCGLSWRSERRPAGYTLVCLAHQHCD